MSTPDKSQIKSLPRGEKIYPARLARITDPPAQLFVRGNLDHTGPHLAVVGTRTMTPYGRFATEALVMPLARAGVVIVSGLAFGVDATAHTTCLKAEGKTIAVLAGGVDDASIGPKTNLPLAHAILEKDGALVSEYAPGSPPRPETFPQRNRIIAGLSDAVLVIEAPEESGALITARLALEYDRDVLVVPGPITSPMSAGTNALLRLGATAITSPEDVLEALNLERVSILPLAPQPSHPVEQKILIALDQPHHLDELVRALQLDTATVTARLSVMELNGLVKNLGGNRFIKVT